MSERSRRFQWQSSTTDDPSLSELSRRLAHFYGKPATRDAYQRMVDADDSSQPVTESALRKAVLESKPARVLEVGCGSGRIYQRLVAEGFAGKYCGIELAPEVLARNRAQFPQALWFCASVYGTGLREQSFDAVFAFFVLEHCVFPRKALEEMTRVLRPGGRLLLVFPDFPAMGRLASQSLGFREGRASEHLRKADPFNAVINLYEARIRLPRALKRATRDVGAFPVNLNPRCLHNPVITPDVDAVYISSKREVEEWAHQNDFKTRFPAGTQGNFAENALVEITC